MAELPKEIVMRVQHEAGEPRELRVRLETLERAVFPWRFCEHEWQTEAGGVDAPPGYQGAVTLQIVYRDVCKKCRVRKEDLPKKLAAFAPAPTEPAPSVRDEQDPDERERLRLADVLEENAKFVEAGPLPPDYRKVAALSMRRAAAALRSAQPSPSPVPASRWVGEELVDGDWAFVGSWPHDEGFRARYWAGSAPDRRAALLSACAVEPSYEDLSLHVVGLEAQIAALEAAARAPSPVQQEPVAWMIEVADGRGGWEFNGLERQRPDLSFSPIYRVRPLYAGASPSVQEEKSERARERLADEIEGAERNLLKGLEVLERRDEKHTPIWHIVSSSANHLARISAALRSPVSPSAAPDAGEQPEREPRYVEWCDRCGYERHLHPVSNSGRHCPEFVSTEPKP